MYIVYSTSVCWGVLYMAGIYKTIMFLIFDDFRDIYSKSIEYQCGEYQATTGALCMGCTRQYVPSHHW